MSALHTSFRSLQRADVLDNRLAPAIDVRPLAVADAVLIERHRLLIRIPSSKRHFS